MLPTRRPTPILDLLLETLLIALLIFLPAALGTVDAWSEMVAFSIGGVMTTLLVLRQALNPERSPGRWIVYLPIALFLLLAAVQLTPVPSEIVKAISPRTHELKTELLDDLPNARAVLAHITLGFYALGTRHDLRIVLLAVVVLATVTSVHRDPRRMRRLLIAITLIALAAAMLALAQTITRTDRIYWRIPIGEPARNGPFVNHSHFGQFINLSIGAALALVLTLLAPQSSTPGSRWRWLGAIGIGATIALGWLTIALSLTRGGMISAAAAGAFALLALLMLRHLRWLAIVLVVLAGVAGAMLWHLGAERVIARMQSADFGGGRAQMASDIWRMSREFPVLGSGLGTFEWVFPAYDQTMSLSTAAYADNEYLQLLAETGWTGVTIVLLFVAIVWFHWARAIRGTDRAKAAAAIGLGYGLLAVMIHSLSDFGQHIPANTCLSAVVCGLIINLGSAPPRVRTRSRWGSAIVVGVFAIALAAWMIVDAERARRAEADWKVVRPLARRMEREDWRGDASLIEELTGRADAAIAWEPGDAYRRYWRAVYTWRLARRQHDPGTPDLIEAARRVVDQLNAARALCPTYGAPYAVLGQIEYAHLGLPIGITHVRTAARLDLNDPTAWFAAGRIDAQRGRFAEANERFRHALDLDWTQINDITDLYIDELNQPQAAIDLAEGSYYRTAQVGNALMKVPKYAKLGSETYQHSVNLHFQDAKRKQAPADLVAMGGGLLQSGDSSRAEELLADALTHEPQNVNARALHAEALIALRRFDDAQHEIETIRRQQPDAPQIQDLIKRLGEAQQAR